MPPSALSYTSLADIARNRKKLIDMVRFAEVDCASRFYIVGTSKDSTDGSARGPGCWLREEVLLEVICLGYLRRIMVLRCLVFSLRAVPE